MRTFSRHMGRHVRPPEDDMSDFIPVSEPDIGEAEREAVLRCLEAGWISSEGPFVREFEEAVASWVGRRFGVAVSSGTAALDIAVAALDIGPGDEVIVPTFTIMSCVHQVVRSGAKPVFVDCDPDTWNARVEDIAAVISPRTRAIVIPHIYGLTTDVEALERLARENAIHLIEDAAEALGQEWHGRRCGSFGVVSTLSFYPNKLITTGEGGMVLTDDEDLAKRLRRLRNLAFAEGPRFRHDELGWNYRMGSLQAAIGSAQLASAEDRLARKRSIGLRYQELLGNIESLQLPVDNWQGQENVYWVFGFVIDRSAGMNAQSFGEALRAQGVDSRPFFFPLHQQVALRDSADSGRSFPNAERIAEQGLYVPSGANLVDADLVRVADAIRAVLS